MKVIKNEDVANATPEIDQVKLAELKEKFDLTQNQLITKEYDILLNEEQTEFLFNDVYENIVWKGYESYAISESHDILAKLIVDGKLLLISIYNLT